MVWLHKSWVLQDCKNTPDLEPFLLYRHNGYSLQIISYTHVDRVNLYVLIMLGNLWVFDFWTNYAGIGPFSGFGSICILPIERKDIWGLVCQWRLEKLLTSDYIRFLRSKGYIWFHSVTHPEFLCYYKSNVHPIIFYI